MTTVEDALERSRAHEVRPKRRAAAEPNRRDFVFWLSALSLVGLGRPSPATPGEETAATAVARAWLDLVDGGAYAASWEQAAPALKDAVRKDQWDTAVRAVRGPLGRCLSRTLSSRRVVDAPAGAPPGHYVVLHFESTFERNGRVIETVTPALGEDGQWRVAAYFVR